MGAGAEIVVPLESLSAQCRKQAVDVANNRVRRLQHELKQAQEDLRRAAFERAVNNPQVAKSYDAV